MCLVSPLSHPALAGSCQLPHSAGWEAPITPQEPRLPGQPAGDTEHLLLSDRAGERILLSPGGQSAVSFLHPGSVLSTREKNYFCHLPFIRYEQRLIHPDIPHIELLNDIADFLTQILHVVSFFI